MGEEEVIHKEKNVCPSTVFGQDCRLQSHSSYAQGVSLERQKLSEIGYFKVYLHFLQSNATNPLCFLCL